MLYETLAQPKIVFIFILIGFFCGFLFDIKNIFLSFFKKRIIINHFFTFFCVFLLFFIFFITNLKLNYGQLRFFIFATFMLAFFIQRFLITNFVAKDIIKCYNYCKDKCNAKKRQRQKNK